MKKLITILFMFLLFAAVSCELESEEFNLTYKLVSEEPIELNIIYKINDAYITETITTPFEITREMKLNDQGMYYFYLQTTLVNNDDLNKKLYGYVYADCKWVGSLYNDPYWPKASHVTSGYVSNGDNTSTVTIDMQ
ncbi:MAG: hypothetical protein JW864_06165 [Spirochaetes bacterium]|nr:hypothetical protein [Spirochaetota bacterium]